MSADEAPDDQLDAQLDDQLDDLKSKMREALAKKNSKQKGVQHDGPLREKAHGSEVAGAGPKMHRRKAGGGGA